MPAVRSHAVSFSPGGSLLVGFAVAWAGMLAVALLQGPKPFHFDAAQYWGLGRTFGPSGDFSLLNFDSPLRGYLLPLANVGLRDVAGWLTWDSTSLVKPFNALALAAITTLLAPKLAELAWPERAWGAWRRIALAGLALVFWRGYLNFPLSDLPALAAALLVLIALSHGDSLAWMLVAGVAAAAAINLRPAYVVLLPIIVVLIALGAWDRRPHATPARTAACVLVLLCGFVAVSLPQSRASHRHGSTSSFIPGAAAKLASLQFSEGMRLQRYETYVGTGRGRRHRMEYRDETGSRILREQADGRIGGTGEYLGIVVRHPVELAGLFARHAINGVDQRYSTPYVEHLDTGSRRWLRPLGFLLVFLALVRLAWPAARRGLGRAQWRYPVALAACAVASIPSAVETRFLLPIHFLTYVLVLAPGWPSPLASARSLRASIILLLAFAAFSTTVLYVVGNATEQLRIV